MKRLLLFTATILSCSSVFSQQSNKVDAIPIRGSTNSISVAHARTSLKKSLNATHTNPSRQLSATTRSAAIASEHIIGTTTYDQQTNGSISNRLINNGDNTLSAVWTMSHANSNTGWNDRGTGYNYFDGNAWGTAPATCIEPFRVGSTNIAVATSGEEIVLAHGNTRGLAFTHRPVKGTGNWTTDSIPGTTTTDLWPKITAAGANGQSFHAIWRGSGTAIGPIYYSRSTDNGTTWSSPIQIPGLDTGIFYRGWRSDSYSIDSRGDVVAVVAGDLGADLVLVKSTDNGITWTQTIIDSFPIPMYDGATMNTDTNNDGTPDTLFSNTGAPAVLIDNNDSVHVFFGGTRVYEVPGATALNYFFTSGLYYWNERMLPNDEVLLATPPDLNGDSVISLPVGCNNIATNYPMGYYGTGLREFIQLPSAGVDTSNNLYVVYQAVDELSDTTLFFQDFMHPYIIYSPDNGTNWTDPNCAYDVVQATQPGAIGAQYDGVYAAMAKRVDDHVHIIYQRDFAPGITVGPTGIAACEPDNNAGASNDIVYVRVDRNDIGCVPIGIQSTINSSFTVSANYPNPFNGKTSFDINLQKFSDVSVEVSNMLGEVLSINQYSNLNAGIHTLTIDGSKFSAGIYAYKVKAGNDVVTRKMTVQ